MKTLVLGDIHGNMYNEIQEIICECKGDGKEVIANYYQPEDQSLFKENVKQGWFVSQTPFDQEELKKRHITVSASLEECPSCHEKTLIHQGGCIQCNSCGYSKCS